MEIIDFKHIGNVVILQFLDKIKIIIDKIILIILLAIKQLQILVAIVNLLFHLKYLNQYMLILIMMLILLLLKDIFILDLFWQDQAKKELWPFIFMILS